MALCSKMAFHCANVAHLPISERQNCCDRENVWVCGCAFVCSASNESFSSDQCLDSIFWIGAQNLLL